MSCLCVLHLYTISTHALYITALCDPRLRLHPSSATHAHTHAFACLYDHTCLCLYLILSVHSGCLFGYVLFLFLSKLAMKHWSTCSAQVNPSHPFEPPLHKHPSLLSFFNVHGEVEIFSTHFSFIMIHATQSPGNRNM